MSLPGWYPDPAGAPGRFRYWDGAAWSQETTADPSQGAPVGGPSAPGGPQPERRRGLGWVAALAVVVVLALLAWALFKPGSGSSAVEDTNTSSPTGPVWNEKDTPTPSSTGSTPGASNGAQVSCPDTGGNILPTQSPMTSAGLSVEQISGWDYASGYSTRVVHDVQMQEVVTEQGMRSSWLNGQLVGRLANSDGFTDVRTSALQVMSCFASSAWYEDFTDREDLTNESTTISGHKAWHIRSNIHVDSSDLPNIQGDRVDIIVVDTGEEGSLAVWAGWATIGDDARGQLVDQAMKTLKVG